MMSPSWIDLAKSSLPQLLTASRIVFGTAAIIATLKGQFYVAATLITLGSVTDGIDGFVSRRLGVSSSFGAVFDYFADYLCFVIAPWILLRGLLAPEINLWLEVGIGFPLIFGAARYARNTLIATGQTKEVRDMPGLATVFFTFLPVAIIFLDLTEFLDQGTFRIAFGFVVVLFSLLMVAPIRYPKLTRVPGLLPVVLALLVLMPFVGTRVLATAMLPLGLSYVLVAPLLTRRSQLDSSATFIEEEEQFTHV